MKTLIKILFLLIIISHLGFTQWYQQISGITDEVTSISFLNANKGFATSGLIYLSSEDGGSSWFINSGSFNNYYKDVFFVSQNIGWLLGRHIWQNQEYRSVLNTTNGGSSWYTSLNQISPWQLYSIHFVTENIGWVVGTIGTILKTNNNTDWELQISNTSSYLNSVFFIDSLNGWAVGDQTNNSGSNIIKTTDGGINWLPQEELTIHSLHTVFFKDINNGWIAGDNGMLFQTTDAGNNWSFQITGIDTNYMNRFLEIFFADQENGWIVGTNGLILNSNDGGQSWDLQESGTNANLNCVFFIDESTGWTAGDDGTILHTTNGGISTVEDKKYLLNTFKLEQNYPNPFNPTTNISYQLPVTSNVTLKVYDILGNEVATLVNEEKSAGIYEIEFKTHFNKGQYLSNGIYFYQLKTIDPSTSSSQSFIETRKMMLIK